MICVDIFGYDGSEEVVTEFSSNGFFQWGIVFGFFPLGVDERTFFLEHVISQSSSLQSDMMQ